MFLHLPLNLITAEMREEIDARQDEFKNPNMIRSVGARDLEYKCGDGDAPPSK